MSKNQKIGLITATSLVIGNMVGVGIFVLPSALADYGSISLLGWIFTAAGALILAKIFSNFSKIIVNKSGGPYIFAKEGFGDFIGFLVAWGYWISIWVSNGAIAIAIVGALTFFFPILATSSLAQISVGLSLIWFFTYINSRGVKASGRFQVVTTALKILPLIFVILMAIFYFDIDNFPAFNLSSESDFATLPVVATLTLYAFLGIESATIPAENVKNPEKIVPRATMWGTIFTASLYIASTIALFGILPIGSLQDSPAPFAEAAKLVGGDLAGNLVAIGVIISGLGVLNGWILLMGQIPMATAKDQLFPKIFKTENKNGAPIIGLIIGSLFSTAVMLMNFTEGLVEQFKFIVEICVFSNLMPYLFVTTAYLLVMIERKTSINPSIKKMILGALGMAFSVWALYGSGRDIVFYGFFLLLAGIPFYVLIKWNKNRK